MMLPPVLRRCSLLLITGALLSPAATAMAQTDYPVRPVRIIVPNPPGGIIDINARLVGEALSRKWGQQVLIENRPGGGGDIGRRAAGASPADGYTLFSTTNSQTTIDPVLNPESARQNDAFVPVIQIAENRISLVAGPGFKGENFADLVNAAKASPGQITYSTAGVASVPHLAAEWIASAAGIKLRHIPFAGGAASVAAAASGEVALASVATSTIKPFVESKRVRPLIVASPTAGAVAEGWPTSADFGLRQVNITVWSGLFARKGTPDAILAKIESDVKELLADADFRGRLLATGGEASSSAGASFAKKISDETAVIGKIVSEAKITAK